LDTAESARGGFDGGRQVCRGWDRKRTAPRPGHFTKEAAASNRPFSRYIQLLLAAGLQLVYFDEPTPIGGEATKAERYRRSPYFHIMEWQKT
jgi:predicted DNA-binding transcriptional regulator YafY